ncbi:Hypothetical protein GLP15_1953 [Giardia lamblia P15]|uniref:Uncharacterized protein n=1 Tax=Giardia intestinalis (strain P15) TaxID=658858 RepID=E1F654_GIAIA|nr:Hypothetical protein GLP15_1953 [Giardia lamblia P15]
MPIKLVFFKEYLGMEPQQIPCGSLVLLPFTLETEQSEIPFDMERIVPAELKASETIARNVNTVSRLVFRGHEMYGSLLELPADYVVTFHKDSGATTAHDRCTVFLEPGDQPQPSPHSIVGLYQMMF